MREWGQQRGRGTEAVRDRRNYTRKGGGREGGMEGGWERWIGK